MISSTAIDVCDQLNDDKGSTMMKIHSIRGNVIFHQRQAGKLAGQVLREEVVLEEERDNSDAYSPPGECRRGRDLRFAEKAEDARSCRR